MKMPVVRATLRDIGCAVVIVAVVVPLVTPRTLCNLPRQSTCMSNLKEVVLGLMMYLQDHNDRLPGCAPGASESEQMAFCTSWGRAGVRIAEEDSRTAAEALRKYIKSPDLYYCPSDTVSAPIKSTPDADHLVSYFYRPAIQRAAMMGATTAWFTEPHAQMVLFERLPFHRTSRRAFLWFEERRSDNKAIKGWKPGAEFNVAFMDGHIHFVSGPLHTTSGVDVADLPDKAGPLLTKALSRPGWPCWFNHDSKTNKATKSNAWDPRRYRDEVE